MHISICICTYQRPELLKYLLDGLERQITENQFYFSIVVVDNDKLQSAKQVVHEFISSTSINTAYYCEPRRSISYARNKTLEHAKGTLIAFIDDDEIPERDWLYNLYKALIDFDVAGVLGPVRPCFNSEPPGWIVKGKFYLRPEHNSGFAMPCKECRTGNVLFRRSIINSISPVFLPEFGAGGGDIEFFRRMIDAGHKFIWCNEAVVYEVVPSSRTKRSFLIKRALLRGRMNMRQPRGRLLKIAKSLIAIPIYFLALPFLQLAGHHHFMKFLVRICDHSGRLLALFGLNPVRVRQM